MRVHRGEGTHLFKPYSVHVDIYTHDDEQSLVNLLNGLIGPPIPEKADEVFSLSSKQRDFLKDFRLQVGKGERG